MNLGIDARRGAEKVSWNSRWTGHFKVEGFRAASREDAILNLLLKTCTGAGSTHPLGSLSPSALLANFSITEMLTIPSAKPCAERTEAQQRGGLRKMLSSVFIPEGVAVSFISKLSFLPLFCCCCCCCLFFVFLF